MKKKYEIELMGCDDSTLFDIELTEEELKILKKIEEISKKVSKYSCIPTLSVYDEKS